VRWWGRIAGYLTLATVAAIRTALKAAGMEFIAPSSRDGVSGYALRNVWEAMPKHPYLRSHTFAEPLPSAAQEDVHDWLYDHGHVREGVYDGKEPGSWHAVTATGLRIYNSGWVIRNEVLPEPLGCLALPKPGATCPSLPSASRTHSAIWSIRSKTVRSAPCKFSVLPPPAVPRKSHGGT
jgi:hypothetical protein